MALREANQCECVWGEHGWGGVNEPPGVVILGRGGCCKIIVRIFKICLKKEEKRRSPHTKYRSEITHTNQSSVHSPAD